MLFLSLLLTCAMPDQPIDQTKWYCYDDIAYQIDADGLLSECQDGESHYIGQCQQLSDTDWVCDESAMTISCNDDYCIVDNGTYSFKLMACDC